MLIWTDENEYIRGNSNPNPILNEEEHEKEHFQSRPTGVLQDSKFLSGLQGGMIANRKKANVI